MEKFKILRIKGTDAATVEDTIAREVPFTLILDGEELATFLCTPAGLEDLARGFLFTSGLIKTIADIKNLSIDEQSWTAYIKLAGPAQNKELVFKRLYTSGCGRGTLFYNAFDIIYRSKINSTMRITAAAINALLSEFQKKSQLYLQTGGAHSAALTTDKEIVVFREDIGRHNAIDKVIGRQLAQGGRFCDKILITSGRISSEVVQKARKCEIPIVVSKSAPTDQAVRHAQSMDITLIGFARGNRMNIYSCAERIVIQQ